MTKPSSHGVRSSKNLSTVAMLATVITACVSARNHPRLTPPSADTGNTPTSEPPQLSPPLAPTRSPRQPTPLLPTWTPLPTIQPDILDSYLLSLIDDPDCRLPCWWRIVVGSTTWPEAQQLLQSLGARTQAGTAKSQGSETFYMQFPLPEKRTGGARLYILEGVVASIFVGDAATQQRYELPQVLSEYGQPDDVLIRTFASAPEPYLPFNLVLVYRDLGFLAEYEFPAVLSGSVLQGCPGDTSPRLHIGSPSGEWTTAEIEEEVLGQDPSTPLRTLGEVTSLTIPAFLLTFYQGSTESCIETEVSNWE